jgi:4-hydroxy-4-methyl-2-oxoglutarate aldolase
MERVPRGSVLVVGTGNFIAGYWGEVLTVAAEAAGVVGLIIHRRFPVFARGVSVRGTIKASAPAVGQPTMFVGVPVAIGDLVVADDDGVIIIPAAEAERTIAAGEARAAKEAVMMKQLAQGATTLELMGLTQWRKCS